MECWLTPKMNTEYVTLKISVWLGVFMLQSLKTALAGGLGQMSLVSDYQMFRPNLGSSSVVMRYLYTGGGGAGEMAVGGKLRVWVVTWVIWCSE